MDSVVDKNPRTMCRKGYTPLHAAAQEGHLDICELIVKYASDKNPIKNDRITPLHIASYKGHLEICKLLIHDAADKSPQDGQGMTPLHFAAEYGNLEVCKFLMEKSEKNPRDNFGDTPLGLAKKNMHFKTACFITKYLANQRFQANQKLTTWLHVKLLSTCLYLFGY
jgi:ankyrin repeat protein